MSDSPIPPSESSSLSPSFRVRLFGLPRDFVLFVIAATLYAFSQSAVTAVFNNFLNQTYSIGNFQRGLLELPREMPGFLVVFVSALLYLMSSRRLAALANLLGGLGIAGIALFSRRYGVMLAWLFLFSVGQHLFMPLIQSITMEFAAEGQAGRRLGQVTGASNLAGIGGSLLILVGFRSLGFGFATAFLIAASGLLLAALLIRTMKADPPPATRTRFVVRREYKLYYWLSILYGTRKQIFLTFSPWVLVTIFKQPTQTVASLLFVQPVAWPRHRSPGRALHSHGRGRGAHLRVLRLRLLAPPVWREHGFAGGRGLLHPGPDADVRGHGPRHLLEEDRRAAR